MTERETAPTRFASRVGLLAAVTASVLVGLYSVAALVFCVAGVLLLAGSIRHARQAAATLGTVSLFIGVLFAGLRGAPELLLLLSGVGAVLAWDSACTAIGLGAQLGRQAPTRRVELAHVTATGVVGGVAVTGAFALYATGIDGPVIAVLFFALAIVMIASALR